MRAENEIFDELAALCVLPGYVHAIAFLCTRDNMIQYDKEIKPENLQNLYGQARLVRTEIMALLGLLVKKEVDYSHPGAKIIETYLTRTDTLLKEMHYAMLGDYRFVIDPEQASPPKTNPFASGSMLRESIFYGAESAYSFQYRDFSPAKYGRDDAWLIANKGYSVHDGRRVVWAVGEIQNEKFEANFAAMRALPPDQWTMLPNHFFSAAEVAEKAKVALDVTERVLTAFTLPVDRRNERYAKLQDFNELSSTPLLKNGAFFGLFNIYSLAEAFYQSPFYWMWDDKPYRPTAMDHRGKFTEELSASRLADVFGGENVHTNVNLLIGKDVVGEIDVLVIFGDRAIILQAKSKQLTIAARQGDDGQLQTDFQKAIQDSCDQAFSCAHFVLNGKVKLMDSEVKQIAIPEKLSKIYLLCVVADHYPALSFQARQFLKFTPDERIAAPFVMDVFLLDAMTEMLDSPLYLLSYIDRRAEVDGRVMSSHELNNLGYHLKQNLFVEGATCLMMLDEDIGTDLNLSMLVRRENLPGPWTPPGILTKFEGTTLGKILKQIRSVSNPAMIGFGFSILCLSEDTFLEFSQSIDGLARRAKQDRRTHDITIQIAGGGLGLTVHAGYAPIYEATRLLQAHCAKRKYTQKAKRWFGISVDPDNGNVRVGVSLDANWEFDEEMEKLTRNMMQPSQYQEVIQKFLKTPKIGRNEKCPCGSGKKNKKCCAV
jgi:hypothetical protein